jgi:hypothetical protein
MFVIERLRARRRPTNEATTTEANLGYKPFFAEEHDLAGGIFDGTVFCPMPNHSLEPDIALTITHKPRVRRVYREVPPPNNLSLGGPSLGSVTL